MKAGLAVMLELARTVAAPAVDVTYVFYACEEVAARHNGLLQVLATRPELLAGDVAILGEPTDGVIEAGCQGTMRVRLTLGGVRAHTARPWMGRNAVHRLAPVLARLAAYPERQPTIDGCTYHEALQAVGVEAGVGGNVVPDAVSLLVNHRFAPDRSPEQAESHVRAVLALELDAAAGDRFEVVDVAAGAPPSLQHPLLAGMIERHGLGVRAKLGWTDVAFFARQGIPAVNFGPGDPELAHTAQERVQRAPVERVHAVLTDLLATPG
jgi:succinyl-diaminopimelate desuccinylase